VDNWGDKVWLNREHPVRGLNVIPFADTPAFVGEPTLILNISQMLNNRVAVQDLYRAILKRSITAIANDVTKPDVFNWWRGKIKKDNTRKRGQKLPVEVRATNIQDQSFFSKLKGTPQLPHSLRPEVCQERRVKIMDIQLLDLLN